DDDVRGPDIPDAELGDVVVVADVGEVGGAACRDLVVVLTAAALVIGRVGAGGHGHVVRRVAAETVQGGRVRLAGRQLGRAGQGAGVDGSGVGASDGDGAVGSDRGRSAVNPRIGLGDGAVVQRNRPRVPGNVADDDVRDPDISDAQLGDVVTVANVD